MGTHLKLGCTPCAVSMLLRSRSA